MNIEVLVDATKKPLKYFDLKDILIVKICMKKPSKKIWNKFKYRSCKKES